MAFLLVTLLVVLYSFQSLFLKLFSAKYPAEKSALASTVFNISYGAFAGITTLCAMGFRFSASKVTLICGLVNAVTLLCSNVSMIQASRKGSYLSLIHIFDSVRFGLRFYAAFSRIHA